MHTICVQRSLPIFVWLKNRLIKWACLRGWRKSRLMWKFLLFLNDVKQRCLAEGCEIVPRPLLTVSQFYLTCFDTVFIKNVSLGASKNWSRHFVLKPLFKRNDFQMTQAFWKWRGCLGNLGHWLWPRLADHLAGRLLGTVKPQMDRRREMARVPSKSRGSALIPWFLRQLSWAVRKIPEEPLLAVHPPPLQEQCSRSLPGARAAHGHVAGGQGRLPGGHTCSSCSLDLGSFQLRSLHLKENKFLSKRCRF